MPTKRGRRMRRSTPKPGARTSGRPPGGTPVLNAADVRSIATDLAERVAPADVTELMAHESELRARCAALRTPHLALFRQQMTMALDCLRDHLDGKCPQIPYHTISLLAGAVSYFCDELDVIPDFLPRLGRLDDAVVMAMACRVAESGVRRYCTWKGYDADALLGVRNRRTMRRPPA